MKVTVRQNNGKNLKGKLVKISPEKIAMVRLDDKKILFCPSTDIRYQRDYSKMCILFILYVIMVLFYIWGQ